MVADQRRIDLELEHTCQQREREDMQVEEEMEDVLSDRHLVERAEECHQQQKPAAHEAMIERCSGCCTSAPDRRVSAATARATHSDAASRPLELH